MYPKTPAPTDASSPHRKRGALIGIALALVAVVTVGVVLVVQASDDGKPASSDTTTTTRFTTTTTSPPRTAEGVAQALSAAWQDGNRAAARRVATPDAVTQMFEVPAWRLPGFRFGHCVLLSDDSKGCRWFRRQDYLTITVTQGDGPPRATAAHFTFGTHPFGEPRLPVSRGPSGPR